MKTILLLAVIAASCSAQVPNTVLIGVEGVTVTAVSSPTAVFMFGASPTWNTVTIPRPPLLISCSSACPLLGGDPAQGVLKSLYAVEQAKAYTVTLSNGTKKTVPALPPPPPVTTTYALTCTGTGTVGGTTMTSSNLICTGKLQTAPTVTDLVPPNFKYEKPSYFGIPQGETPTPKITRSFDGCNTTTYIDGQAATTTLAYCLSSSELSRLLGTAVKQ